MFVAMRLLDRCLPVNAWLVATLLVISPVLAKAQPSPAPAPQAAPAETSGQVKPEAPAQDAKPAAPKGDSLDFDLFGDQPKPAQPGTAPGLNLAAPTVEAQKIERSVHTRRRMLQLHQGFGFATLGLLAVTLVIGQLNYVDKYGGGDYTEKYQVPHLALALGTAAFFATDGILAVAAPTPYKKTIRADAALLHKVMMSIATAGMVTQLALGFVTAAKGGDLIQRDLALGHMVVGYATFASMLTGYLSYVF